MAAGIVNVPFKDGAGASRFLQMFDDGSGNLQPMVPGTLANPTSVLTRPNDTTAYAQNDLIASSTTAGSVVVPSVTVGRAGINSCYIRRIRLVTNKTASWDGITNSVTLRVRLWTAAPTYTNGDNGAYVVATGAAGFLGQYDVTPTQFSDGSTGFGVPSVGSESAPSLGGGSVVYWDIQYIGSPALTPAANQTFTLTPEVVEN